MPPLSDERTGEPLVLRSDVKAIAAANPRVTILKGQDGLEYLAENLGLDEARAGQGLNIRFKVLGRIVDDDAAPPRKTMQGASSSV